MHMMNFVPISSFQLNYYVSIYGKIVFAKSQYLPFISDMDLTRWVYLGPIPFNNFPINVPQNI